MNREGFCMLSVGRKVRVSIFSLLTLLFFFMGQEFLYSLLFLSAAAIHELSHIFFLRLFGADILHITIYPFGIDMLCDTKLLSYKKEIIVTLSGSFANLAFSTAAYAAMCFIPSAPMLFFFVCNLLLAFFNLIPLSFFDGGKALRLILYDKLGIDTAFYISKYLDIASSGIFLTLSILLLDFSRFNLSVAALLVYACISCLFSNTLLHKNAPT